MKTIKNTEPKSDVSAARAALAAAVADAQTKRERCVKLDERLILARREGDSGDPRFLLDVRYPIEIELLELQAASVEADFTERRATHGLAGALDTAAAADGDPDAVCLAQLVSDLSNFASRSQNGGDFAGILRAVDARAAAYEAAWTSLAARRRSAGDPEPLRITPGQAWNALLEVARADTAGLPTSPLNVLKAGHGYIPDLPAMTVQQALDRFLAPRLPPAPTGRLEHLRSELAAVNRAAFDLHEARKKEAAEQAEIAQQKQRSRVREASDDAKQAKEKVAKREKAEAERRELATKEAAFAETLRAKRAASASAR